MVKDKHDIPTLFGHPTGLFMLFFAEMWERFSYYGMRALLVFYMIKGFLSASDDEAYVIYGAYTSLVYMTPFVGGMLADRLLGARRAVVLGGVLMASGHLLMTIEADFAFFGALALLIVGNGFFKPNISTIVGSQYYEGDPRRDGGFTIFYMGINLGAAMSPLLCGYVGETFGWHYGFGLATIGMLVGLAVFVVPAVVARYLILTAAVSTAIAMVALQNSLLLYLVNGFVALALIASGAIAFTALGRSGLDPDLGLPPDPEKLKRPVLGPVSLEWVVYFGVVLVVPVLGGLVALTRTIRLVPGEVLDRLAQSGSATLELVGFLLNQVSTPTGLVLVVAGVFGLGFIIMEALRSPKIERERLFVVISLMFFSLVFWAFFEQAGSSMSLFTDRNVDRVNENRVVEMADVGKTETIVLNQEQLGQVNGHPAMKEAIFEALREAAGDEAADREAVELTIRELGKLPALTLTGLDALRETEQLEQKWKYVDTNVGMGVGGEEAPASIFQSANATYILIFGLVFTALWGFLGRRGMEPSTPVKFALGLFQLGLGFGALWYGAQIADERGMVGVVWLLLAYLLHTTGELCISPVGLSMVTRLSPKRLVSTVMGAWFLAMAFSNYLAAVIAALTGVGESSGGASFVPIPLETVDVYGGVFGNIFMAAMASGVLLLLLTPFLKKWEHPEALSEEPVSAGH